MARFLLFRTVGDVTEEDLDAAGVRSVAVVAEMPEVHWIRSYYSPEEGKVYCEYEAPNVELVFEHARRAGLPLDHAVVVRELEPDMFR